MNPTLVLDSRNSRMFHGDFSATVTNLQAKVESLTTTNALMKEDLAIAKNNILSLQEENRQLKKELGIEIKDANEVLTIIVWGCVLRTDCATTEGSI